MAYAKCYFVRNEAEKINIAVKGVSNKHNDLYF